VNSDRKIFRAGDLHLIFRSFRNNDGMKSSMPQLRAQHLVWFTAALFMTGCQNQTTTSKFDGSQSISITPNPASTNVGTSLRFSAIVRDKNNNLLNPQPVLHWHSSNPGMASIDETTGIAKGIALGQLDISVQGPEVNSSVQLKVCKAGCQAEIDSISLGPNPATLKVGTQLLLNANAKDAAGDQINPQPSFQWASSDNTVLKLSDAGMATGLQVGSATVTASNGTIQGSISIEVTAAATSQAHRKGQWSSIKTWPTLAIHATLMPDGSLETWGWRRTDPFNRTAPTTLTDRWNPSTDEHKTTWETNTDLFGAGHELLEDGRLFVASGSNPTPDEWVGITDINLFSSGSGSSWTASKSMDLPRWYPSVTALPNGEVLVTSGTTDKHTGNYLNEVFTPSSNTWRTLTDAARRPGHSENFVMPNYPFMHVAADGRVFYAGPTPSTAYLTTTGTGKWENGERQSQNLVRTYGSSVQFDADNILVMGGSPADIQADSSAMILDMSSNGHASPTGAMASPRRNLNATVLPDGTVLATGGNDLNYDQGQLPRTAELWNPNSGQWNTLAEQQIPRPYHSVGLLLPDATVFTAGGYDGDKSSNRYEKPGDPKQIKYRNAEIFAPPYLFKKDGSGDRAERPQITNAPTSMTYKQNFNLNVSSNAGISKVNLIKLGSVTHGFNFGQRMVKLNFTRAGGTLTVSAPSNANLAPPGYYMLFVIDANGVPSVARMVQVKR
jgi:Domain of unknown function (DUF1929)/Bacterial Ig-like domain (group 2)